jgi:ABC-type glutathione transport system ATPase component
MGTERATLLQLRGITKRYTLARAWLPWMQERAVLACDAVDLDVARGEVVAVVGESGSGKSTLGRIATLLERPDRGAVFFEGVDLTALGRSELRARRRDLQIIFQDPLSSLNPRWTLGASVAYPLRVHGVVDRQRLSAAVEELLQMVDLPVAFARRYPHQVSGGQRQRVCIARALALRPKLVVADEPTSGLDVSTQLQILDLLQRIRAEAQVAYLFISHDLRVVRHLSSRVAVMTVGKIVEFRATEELFADPHHAYTKQLLASVPRRRYAFRAPSGSGRSWRGRQTERPAAPDQAQTGPASPA